RDYIGQHGGCVPRTPAVLRRCWGTAPHIAKLCHDISQHRVGIPKGRRLPPRYRQKRPIKLVLCRARHFHLSVERPFRLPCPHSWGHSFLRSPIPFHLGRPTWHSSLCPPPARILRRQRLLQNQESFHLPRAQLPEARAAEPSPHQEVLNQPFALRRDVRLRAAFDGHRLPRPHRRPFAVRRQPQPPAPPADGKG